MRKHRSSAPEMLKAQNHIQILVNLTQALLTRMVNVAKDILAAHVQNLLKTFLYRRSCRKDWHTPHRANAKGVAPIGSGYPQRPPQHATGTDGLAAKCGVSLLWEMSQKPASHREPLLGFTEQPLQVAKHGMKEARGFAPAGCLFNSCTSEHGVAWRHLQHKLWRCLKRKPGVSFRPHLDSLGTPRRSNLSSWPPQGHGRWEMEPWLVQASMAQPGSESASGAKSNHCWALCSTMPLPLP
mmetsp:Transcript_135747/g.321680  ORF Transcript_135747/g.321680 Transcript_135747/m.321680 type:complete len:240 (-) Transcript_135747:42-761(-)